MTRKSEVLHCQHPSAERQRRQTLPLDVERFQQAWYTIAPSVDDQALIMVCRDWHELAGCIKLAAFAPVAAEVD
jgi:hypothetical protein